VNNQSLHRDAYATHGNGQGGESKFDHIFSTGFPYLIGNRKVGRSKTRSSWAIRNLMSVAICNDLTSLATSHMDGIWLGKFKYKEMMEDNQYSMNHRDSKAVTYLRPNTCLGWHVLLYKQFTLMLLVVHNTCERLTG
jgi:hypothetical protein